MAIFMRRMYGTRIPPTGAALLFATPLRKMLARKPNRANLLGSAIIRSHEEPEPHEGYRQLDRG
jgi:hypothetical protein